MPPEEPVDDIEELLFKLLCEIDEGADPEELLARYPQHAEVLRRRFGYLTAIHLDRTDSWAPPVQIGPYRLMEQLGGGGMGDVWRAEHAGKGGEVALKIVRGAVLVPNQVRRFAREAAALRRLNHPNIVGIQDVGEADGYQYIAMDLLEGQSLHDLLKERRPAIAEVLSWGLDLALALSAAHAKGVLHRDIKPSNIQVTPEGQAILLDFGLTRELGPSSLSVTGKFVGSPHYSPPEQVEGQHDVIGPGADIYALGATLYQAASGSLPFEGESTEQVFHRILTEEPIPLRRHDPSIPRDLESVIHCALEKRPEKRYRTADRMAADFAAALASRPVAAKRIGRWRRFKNWSRRRPALVAALLIVSVAGLAGLSGLTLAQLQERWRRQEAAAEKLEDASQLLDRFIDQSDALPQQIAHYRLQLPIMEAQPILAEEVKEMDRLLWEIEVGGAHLEQAYTEVLELLRQAEELDTASSESRRLRARLFLQRWRLAKADGDRLMMEFFAEQVKEFDDTGSFTAEVDARRQVEIRTSPPGARVDGFLFRRQDHLLDGGAPRMVLLPLRAESADGQVFEALRVFASPPPLQPEDLLLEVNGEPIQDCVFLQMAGEPETYRLLRLDGIEISDIGQAEDLFLQMDGGELTLDLRRDGQESSRRISRDRLPLLLTPLQVAQHGGVDALMRRAGQNQECVVPVGAVLRPTASALWTGADSLLGTGPQLSIDLPEEAMLLVVQAEGYAPARQVLEEGRSGSIEIALDPISRYPQPFRRFYHSSFSAVVMDREVNCGEYRLFLEADPSQPLPKGWRRESDGRIAFSEELGADFPVQGISWQAAQAYAAWRTEQATALGKPYRFRLPAHGAWASMVRAAGPQWDYVWGSHYRASYTKSCFSRLHPRPEPALRFPIDETVLGLHDTAGGVSELCDGWFWREQEQRPVSGGSWVNGDSRRFRSKALWGTLEDATHEHVGFRLILEDAP